jgi:NitT/TauT family transport system substrate-binding protein
MTRAARIIVAGFLVLAVVGSAPLTAQPVQKVVFALNWFAVGDHAAYWVALDKGYYRTRGLDVEMQNSKGSGDSIAKVDTERADIGLADSAVVIAAVGRGAKVKVVGMVFDKTPMNNWSRRDAPISKPKDLEGKTVGAPPGDGQRQMFPAFAKLTGIDPSKVTWVNIEPAAKVPALAEKRVDSVADYTTGRPFYEKAMGKGNAVMMPWADFGFDLYSISIMASEKTMTQRAQVLRDFLAASYQGWRDVMENPKAALEIFKKRVPEIDAAIIEPNMMMGLDLMKTERYAQHGIGWMEDKKMCHSVDLVNTYMGVPNKIECRAVYTNEFLTKVELPRSMRP